MPCGDLLTVLQHRMPNRPLLDLIAVVRHTESSGTLCSVTNGILIRWCGASYLHQVGPLPLKRPAEKLPESQSKTYSCPTTFGAASKPSHGLPLSARAPS
jgi:hypothetical protein